MYAIGELSRRTGLKIPTIRYYEQIGLVPAPERSTGNQRRYDHNGLERLMFIRHARDLGFSINDVCELIDLEEELNLPCRDAHDIAQRHFQSVQHRLSKLRKLEKELKRISEACAGGAVGNCGVVQTLSDHRQCSGDH